MSFFTTSSDDPRYSQDVHKPSKIERFVDKVVEATTGRCSLACGDVECPAVCPLGMGVARS